MRTIALVCLIAIFFTAFYGLWILSVSLYILMGIVWVKRELGVPFAHKRMASLHTIGIFWLFLLWPLIVIYDCYESWQIISSGKRFIAHDGDCVRGFPDWNSAVECARKIAKESNEKEMIYDKTIFIKQCGMIQHKCWFVYPDGRVKKLPRYAFDPKWLSLLRRMLLGVVMLRKRGF